MLTRKFGAPVTLYFLKVADRYVDRSTKVNLEIRFGTSIAKPNDFSTQHSTPESSTKRMQSESLISGYSVASRKHFHGTRSSQESCELAGKADFSGWIFDTVIHSGLFWRHARWAS
jgi:hypothetical protein